MALPAKLVYYLNKHFANCNNRVKPNTLVEVRLSCGCVGVLTIVLKQVPKDKACSRMVERFKGLVMSTLKNLL